MLKHMQFGYGSTEKLEIHEVHFNGPFVKWLIEIRKNISSTFRDLDKAIGFSKHKEGAGAIIFKVSRNSGVYLHFFPSNLRTFSITHKEWLGLRGLLKKMDVNIEVCTNLCLSYIILLIYYKSLTFIKCNSTTYDIVLKKGAELLHCYFTTMAVLLPPHFSTIITFKSRCNYDHSSKLI